MLRLRVTFACAADLRRVLEEEMRRGVMLVKVAAPPDLEFRAPLAVEIASPGGALSIGSEVVQILPGVGVAVAFPADRLEEARRLLASTPDGPPAEAVHEIAGDAAAPGAPGATTSGTMASQGGGPKGSFGEKVQLALHGTKDDRAAILRDQNKQLHPFVLKSPHVSPEEVAGWAANAQMSADFLKQIAERKEWLSRPAIALALARNPKTPAEVGLKALEYVPAEHLRQMAKGIGVLPHIVQAARKKILPK
jgi:hypothetical protein